MRHCFIELSGRTIRVPEDMLNRAGKGKPKLPSKREVSQIKREMRDMLRIEINR